MAKADLRAQLEAIASGKPPAGADRTLVDQAALEQEQRTFRAWHQFAHTERGEPLAAPTELLAPLP